MSFQIYAFDAPGGGTLGISPLPGRWGHGLDDLGRIAAWPADLVISMTELAEMDRYNMADLGGMLAQHGIGWAHFPIRDFGAPKADADWQAIAKQAHAAMDRGGKVLAHCFGGQGRSGMVALRLMVERGMETAQALAEIRKIRPGAVETEPQLAWAAKPLART